MPARFLRTLLAFAFTGPALRAADWPGYRGPTGMGFTAETDLPLTWGGTGDANVLWKVPLPGTEAKGKPDHNQSSPIIWKDSIFVTTSDWPTGRTTSDWPVHHVARYRLADGKRLWDTPVPAGPLKLTDLRGGYTAPTPCTDGDRVYVQFGSATLAALDFAGKIVWQRDVPDGKDFDVAIASSPVLFDGRLYLLADRNNKKSTLTAFDPKTGKPLWVQKRTTGFSHTTPVFVRLNGAERMLVASSSELQALDPATGERVWWCKTPGDVASPVVVGDFIYTDSGRGGPGVGVEAGGTGDVTKTHKKWTIRTVPEGLSSAAIVGDYLYRLYKPDLLMCVERNTGTVAYREHLNGASTASSPVVAPGRIYFASAGKSFVVDPGPKFRILATNDLGEPSQASAAVAAGRIVLKGSKHLFCVGKP
jgi:outer membrane protein assembly factor BamB